MQMVEASSPESIYTNSAAGIPKMIGRDKDAESWRARFLVLLFLISATSFLNARASDQLNEGKPTFLLETALLQELSVKASHNCPAALSVAKHHLYVTHHMFFAEKFFRLAYRCPSVDSIEGLLAVLRGAQHDEEIDRLVAELKSINPERGRAAQIEIEERRFYRNKSSCTGGCIQQQYNGR